MSDTVAMIVVAAGQGRRFGTTLPKQYLTLQERPILYHTLKRLHDAPLIHTIIPVIAPDGEKLWQEIMTPWLSDLPKVTDPVAGGAERQHSVFQGILSLIHKHGLKEEHWIGIHDGARPLVDQGLLTRLFQARDQSDALVPTVAPSDTIKRIDSEGKILNTPSRKTLRLVQTPQLFRLGLIHQAHQQAAINGFIGTDDASLVERMGGIVYGVEGTINNIKITRPLDRDLANLLLLEEKS